MGKTTRRAKGPSLEEKLLIAVIGGYAKRRKRGDSALAALSGTVEELTGKLVRASAIVQRIPRRTVKAPPQQKETVQETDDDLERLKKVVRDD